MSLPKSFRKSNLLAAVLGLCLALVPPSVGAQKSPKPLSKDEVIRLLKGDVPPARVAEMVQERGIDFALTAEVESELRQAGAAEPLDPLLETLRKLARKPHPPPSHPIVLIESKPGGGQVYLDDEFAGKTSPEGRLRISTLAPGQHRLRVSLDGYKDYEQTIKLVAGETKRLPTILEALKRQAPPLQANTNAQAEDHYKRGNEFSNESDWDGAVQEYREAIRLKPDDAEAHRELGVALGKKKDQDGALAEFREAIRLKPNYAEAHRELGVALGWKQYWDGDIAEQREAIRLKPDDAQAHRELGAALRNKRDWNGAVFEYREAIRLKPSYAEAHNELGLTLANKEDWDGAIAEYREAIRLTPDYAPTHNNLGIALRNKGNRDGAIAEYREAIRLNPDDPHAHDNLGIALGFQGNWDGAIAEYREAVRLKSDFTIAHHNLGLALEKKGELGSALVELRRAYELEPKNSRFQGDYERVLKELNK